MTWLVWRQYRLQFFLGAALLAAFAVLIVITGAQAANRRWRSGSRPARCCAGYCRPWPSRWPGSSPYVA